MKKKIIILNICMLLTFFLRASDRDSYQYSLDLTKVKDDRLEVTLITPEINKKDIVYHFPKIIPGSYSYNDYGRFISEFKAFDKNGKELKIKKLNENSYKIKKAKKLYKISYWVDDTYDTEIEKKPAPMSGTNIYENKVFIINPSGFFGYLEGMKTLPMKLIVRHPENLYGSTGLIAEKRDKTSDTYKVNNYGELIDAPLMYNEPDTTILQAGGADILVSVYAENENIKSSDLAKELSNLLEAQRKYLGGTLPVKKYAYLLYFGETNSGHMFGALEHSYSTLCTLPSRIPPQYASKLITDIGAHEFFHIVTPLNIHSEQIHDFDFNKPEMSKHLWMYEGVTEYSANHVLAKYGIIDHQEFLSRMREKIIDSKNKYNDALSFTALSENCFEKYQDQYQNVYQKGALIGLCLDIKLRALSGGNYGMQQLMRDLSSNYGKEKAYSDDDLFDEITALTFPEIGEFFKKHVVGTEPLPFKEIFELVGVSYIPEQSKREYSIGDIAIGFDNKTKNALVHSIDKINEFGLNMGYQKGDIILKINGKELSEDVHQLTKYLTDLPNQLKEGEVLKMTVLRKDESGKESEIELSAEIFKPVIKRTHVLSFKENLTVQQKKIKSAWLEPEM